MSNQGPRYATVGDYLRVIRRRRLLVAGIVLAFVAAALAFSLTQPTEYTARSQLSVRDPLQDLVLLGQGTQTIPELSPAQRAAIAAELVTSREVTRRVQKELKTEASEDELTNAITTEVDVQTNLVSISAVWSDARFAADLANAFARESRAIGLRDAQERLDAAKESQLDELKDAKQEKPEPGIRISIIEANLQRIGTIESIAKPVEVVQRAELPESPSAPNVARSTALGAILGLAVALIAAFVRDTLDRRLHNAQEVHEELGMPVLGRIGASAFNYAGLASNGYGSMSETEFEAFRVLRMNLAHLSGELPPRTVLVTSALPEEGKSTVSMALASAAALAGQRVLLVETDLRRPSFTHRLRVPRTPGLSDYLQGSANPSDVLQVVQLTEPVSYTYNGGRSPAKGPPTEASLVVITAGSPVTIAPELLQSTRFDHFIEKVGRTYDLVILDGSPLLSVADPLELASSVDAILVCIRVQQTTRDQTRAVRAALSHLPERPAGAVVTGLRRGDETYEYYYGY